MIHRRIDVNRLLNASNLTMNNGPGQLYLGMCVVIIIAMSLFLLHNRYFANVRFECVRREADEEVLNSNVQSRLSNMYRRCLLMLVLLATIALWVCSTPPMQNTFTTENKTSSSPFEYQLVGDFGIGCR